VVSIVPDKELAWHMIFMSNNVWDLYSSFWSIEPVTAFAHGD
jgi:hypothetical protein